MKHIISVGGCGLPYTDFESYILAVKEIGADGTDLEVPSSFFKTEIEAIKANALINELNLERGVFKIPEELLSDDIPDDKFDRALDTLKKETELANLAGYRKTYSNLWSGNNFRSFKDNCEWMCERIGKTWDVLKSFGVKYGVEPLGPLSLQRLFKYPFIRRIDETIDLLNIIDPSLGFVFDTFHWYCAGADNDCLEMVLKNIDRIITVHINDAKPLPVAEQQDLQRGMPLEHGIIDVSKIIRLLAISGYSDTVTIEPLDPWRQKLHSMELKQALETIQCYYNCACDNI